MEYSKIDKMRWRGVEQADQSEVDQEEQRRERISDHSDKSGSDWREKLDRSKSCRSRIAEWSIVSIYWKR